MNNTTKEVDMFLFMGQSNMAGRGAVNQEWKEPAPIILPGAGYEFRAITDPTRLYDMSEPFGVDENIEGGINDGNMKTGSLVTAFTNAYFTYNGNIPVVGISASKGGSRIADWQPGGNFLTDVIRRLSACISYLESHNFQIRHKFLLWCQGESDGDYGTAKEEYLSDLGKMWTELKKYGLEQIFIIGIGNCNIDGAYNRYKNVQTWQKAFARSQSDASIVSTAFEGMRERGLMKDAFHYYQQGYNECGRDAGINTAHYVNQKKDFEEVTFTQMSEEIQHIAFQDAIVLYWEKHECLSHGQYQIFVNDKEVGVTDKTHYTLKNLTPETAYRIRVKEKLQGVNIGDMLVSTAKAKNRLDVTKAPYHAVGDGQTMNTKALQQAFDDCKADEMVYLPAGVYLTGALRMHSDMELYLEEGAVLQGTDVVEDYLPRIKSRFEGIENESYSSLLNLGELNHEEDYNCRNVVIRGKGTIASGGRVLAERVIASERERLADYLAQLGDKIKECEKPETIPGRVRPRLINMSNCQNIVLSGVQLKNGASWNVHMIYSDGIVTNDCTFYSENVWNGDGWDPDSSTNCTIFGCTFYTGDDSVAIKSGKNPEGNQINKPTKHIRIFDCKCAFGHGIAMGSEMSGGIEDVRIWDCDMSNSLCGIEIKGTKKRGGYVRNVQVRDCAAARVMFHAVGYNDDGIGAPVPPVFEHCSFERIQITGEYFDKHTDKRAACDAIELVGFDEPGYELKDILFRDVTIGKEGHTGKQTLTLQLCENITFERLRCL